MSQSTEIHDNISHWSDIVLIHYLSHSLGKLCWKLSCYFLWPFGKSIHEVQFGFSWCLGCCLFSFLLLTEMRKMHSKSCSFLIVSHRLVVMKAEVLLLLSNTTSLQHYTIHLLQLVIAHTSVRLKLTLWTRLHNLTSILFWLFNLSKALEKINIWNNKVHIKCTRTSELVWYLCRW